MFTGKGGVGKTSLAAATGVKLAELNYRTLVMSIDPAHSLADSFDLETDLFHLQTSDPLQVGDRLWIQELNIQKEIKRHWQEISSYVTSVLRTTGISGVEAEVSRFRSASRRTAPPLRTTRRLKEPESTTLRAASP
jgi:arsenite-transporting ATPase